jgi:hypothetical protein
VEGADVKQRYSEEQIIVILHEAAATPTKAEVYRRLRQV